MDEEFDTLFCKKMRNISLTKFQCRDCQKVFKYKVLANIHVRRPSCHETFTKKKKKRVLQCHRCKAKFKSRAELNKHEMKEHSASYSCSTCNTQTKRKYDWRRHLRLCRGLAKIYFCSICRYQSRRSNNIKQHKVRMHTSAKQQRKNKEKFPVIQTHMVDFNEEEPTTIDQLLATLKAKDYGQNTQRLIIIG